MIQQKKHAQLCIGSMGRICLPINLVDFYGRILHTLPSRCNNNGGKPGLRQFWKQRGYLHSSTGVSTPGLLLPIIREHCKKRSWRENNHTSHVLLPFTSDCSPSSSRPPSNQKYLLCRYTFPLAFAHINAGQLLLLTNTKSLLCSLLWLLLSFLLCCFL